jgi:hypothetical protein
MKAESTGFVKWRPNPAAIARRLQHYSERPFHWQVRERESFMVDTDKMFTRLERLIADVSKKPPPVASGMGRWFDYCERVAPKHKSLWRRLRGLDYEKECDRLTEWLKRLLAKEPPPKEVNGWWFGLYNPVRKGETSCQMYLGGSSKADPASESNEWACDLSYLPKGRYPQSQVLAELYRSVDPIEEGDVGYLGECFLCHGYLALVVAHWCHGPLRAALLGDAPLRLVDIGHDNGDFYRIAVLNAK